MADVADLEDLAALYRDLHAHPELAFAERRTASIVAERLHGLGYQVTAGVGGTGVVGVLENGDGPTVLLRADMDALPVLEQTGLPYASTRRVRDAAGADVPVMHACGHDMHVSCLLGAAAELAAQASSGAWQGRLLLVFQPAEEGDGGAQAMIDDGLYDRFPVPDIVLGQHVMPLPAGVLGLHGGPAMAAADAIRVVLYGEGGHGSRPETTVDPVLMAAATVLRLQGIVSREVAASDTAVLTVGALHAGTAANIIPDRAELLLSLRSFDEKVHAKVRDAIDRIVRAEAAASGARKDPEITTTDSFPVLVNDPAAVRQAHRGVQRRRRPDPRPRPGDRQRGRRRAGDRRGRPVRLLVPWRLRPGPVRRGHHDRGGQGHRGRPAVQPLAVLRPGGRADAAHRHHRADHGRPHLPGTRRGKLAVR